MAKRRDDGDLWLLAAFFTAAGLAGWLAKKYPKAANWIHTRLPKDKTPSHQEKRLAERVQRNLARGLAAEEAIEEALDHASIPPERRSEYEAMLHEYRARFPEARPHPCPHVIVFRVAWMDRYEGTTAEDAPTGTDLFVQRHGRAFEEFLFKPHERLLYGYGHPGSRGDDEFTPYGLQLAQRGIRDGDPSTLVVWVARKPAEPPMPSHTVVVGWYRDACVFRHPREQDVPGRHIADLPARYNVTCEPGNAHRVPTHGRTFEVPRGKGGLGNQTHVWYPCRSQPAWVAHLLEYMELESPTG